MVEQRTQVGIIGAGPAGLLLGRLLEQAGIESVILESRPEAHVVDRVRAGVLEQGTVDLLHGVGLGERLSRQGLRHEGIYLAFNGRRHRVDMSSATGGRAITVYGQNEVVRDLIDARRTAGLPMHFGAPVVALRDLDTTHPRIDYECGGRRDTLRCDFIAGCDGFHGVSRRSIPPAAITTYEYQYPYAWLGILANAAPTSHELVYSLHERGFALFSMRSPEVTRLYLQCDPGDDVRAWPDDRVWDELLRRLSTEDGWRPAVGAVTQKGITTMRSVVCEPMQYGRLFLAGDAAHIVPPTGAKGLNLAAADVARLAKAVGEYYRTGRGEALSRYSTSGVRRAWSAQRFSWFMTALLHRSGTDPFEYRRQVAELEYLVASAAAMASLSESYVGTPFD